MKQAISKVLNYKAYKRALQLPESQRPKKTIGIFLKNRRVLQQNTGLKSHETTWTRL